MGFDTATSIPDLTLELKHDEALSNFAFMFNVRRYTAVYLVWAAQPADDQFLFDRHLDFTKPVVLLDGGA
jgi:hypothetical protein